MEMSDQTDPPPNEPYLPRLIESLKILVTCAKTYDRNQNDDDVPTLATLARHYNLEKTNEVLVRVIVILSKLCQSLQNVTKGSIKESQERLPEFFQSLEKESSAIYQLSKNFCTDKKHGHKMEQDITAIRDSLDSILRQLEKLKVQRCSHDNRYHDNKMAECLFEIDLDWTNIDKARNELPSGYHQALQDNEKITEKTSSYTNESNA